MRLGAAGLASTLAGGIARAEAALDPLREQALEWTAAGDVPSLSVAVFQHGRPLWIEAFGWADRERQVRASEHTRYAIASASKPFTATLAARLVQSGDLSLDGSAGALLGLAGLGDVTLRELLQHRSGVPRHWRNFFAGQGRPPPFAEVAERYAFTTPAHGRRYLYSNLNYALAAEAIETTGAPLGERLREDLFEPLGLASAGFLSDHFGDWQAAVPYEDDGLPIPPYRVDERGARDLVMTASDLARFGVAHLEGRLRPATGLMLAERAVIEATEFSRASYGLGWIVEEESPAALFSYGHTGEGPGASSSLAIVPADGLVVATAANAQGAPAYRLNEAVVDALSPRFAERRAAHPWTDQPDDEELLMRLAGRWTGQVRTPEGPVPVELMLASGSEARLSVGGSEGALLSPPTAAGGVVQVRADLRLPTAEAAKWPHQVRLHLEPATAGLAGTLAAYTPRGAVEHEQFWLSHALSLAREPAG